MKFILIAVFISCQAFFQLDAMFNFVTRMNIKTTQGLEEKLVKLSEKNPSNLQLKLYLESINNSTVNKANCYQREKQAQTLLFPLNTHLSERVWKASEQNLPEISSWRLWEWYKKPIAQGYNIVKEGTEIASDTMGSLRVSDAVAGALGYVCAEGIVRRLSNENSMLALAATPLYLAGPLAALWLKKCRFDMYPLAQKTMHDIHGKNRDLHRQSMSLQQQNIDNADRADERIQNIIRGHGRESNELRAANIELVNERNALQVNNNNLIRDREAVQKQAREAQLKNVMRQTIKTQQEMKRLRQQEIALPQVQEYVEQVQAQVPSQAPLQIGYTKEWHDLESQNKNNFQSTQAMQLPKRAVVKSGSLCWSVLSGGGLVNQKLSESASELVGSDFMQQKNMQKDKPLHSNLDKLPQSQSLQKSYHGTLKKYQDEQKQKDKTVAQYKNCSIPQSQVLPNHLLGNVVTAKEAQKGISVARRFFH